MEYTILYDDSSGGLVYQVNKLLKEGWHLHGPPFITSGYTGIYQALVRGEYPRIDERC
jgi:hypothetical protein